MASPEHLRGRYIGAANTMFGIGSATGSVAGLAIWNLVGNAVWWICGLACLLGLLAAGAGMRSGTGEPAEPDRTADRDPSGAGTTRSTADVDG